MMDRKVYPCCSKCILFKEGNCIGQVTGVVSASSGETLPPYILFVGEAPGKVEVEQGYPFAGSSGRLLRMLLDEFGLTSRALLTNAVLCAPSQEVRDKDDWWDVNNVMCYNVLWNVIKEYQPVIIVALGRAAIAHILGKNKKVAFNRRIEVEFPTGEFGNPEGIKIPVYTTYNPAFLLRNSEPTYLNAFRRVLAMVRDELRLYTGKVSQGAPPPVDIINVIKKNHNRELQLFVEELLSEKETERVRIVIDIEVGCPHQGEFDSKSPKSLVVLVGIGDGHGRRYKPFLLYDPDARQPILPLEEFTALKELFERDDVLLIMHNASFELMWFMRAFNIIPKPTSFVDTMVLAHAIDENKPSYSLASLVQEYIPDNPFAGWKEWLNSYATESGMNACFIPVLDLVRYNRADVLLTARLFKVLAEKVNGENNRLNQMLKTFIVQVANPIIITVAHMSATGIPVSLDELDKVRKQLGDLEFEILSRLRTAAPQVSNFNSTPQLVQFLLSKGVTEVEEFKTSKGNYSLTRDVIDKLCEMRPDVEFLQWLKEYREVTKCESTFLRKVPDWVDETTGRIYPNIHITGTKTGRLSTSNPPLHNYPSEKKSLGKVIRRIFHGGERYAFVVSDAKQHELRVLAIKSGDENLRNAFLSGNDVHRANAARILNKPIEEITERERQIGKQFSFAAVYGVSEQGAARIFNLPEEESANLLKQMYAAFPQAIAYLDNVRSRVIKFPGVVHTRLGRARRVLWGLNERKLRSDSPQVERAKRQGGNFIIQAEASDLWCLVAYHVLLEMVRKGLVEMGKNAPPKANIALLIHDSIIIVCEKELVDVVLSILKRAIAIVSYKFKAEDLPITAEYSVYYGSLGDEPDIAGEWSVSEIQQEIEALKSEFGAQLKRFKLFYENYLDEYYKTSEVNGNGV